MMIENLTASVVTTADGVSKSLAIRSAVFIAEQKCPYDEEFDGNDYCATHILGFVNGEPAGTIRLRWFAEFAKMERVCVLPRFRHTTLSDTMIRYAFETANRKGYRRMYGHAQKRLIPFWARYGYRPIQKNFQLIFSDHEYVEVVKDMDPHPEAISLQGDPYVVLRPEGSWDTPGILEQSSTRAATNPH